MTIPHAARLLLVGLVALAFVACGGDSSSEADPEVIVPEETAAPTQDYKTADGFLMSADQRGVVLQLPNGSRMVFDVREIDAATLGLEHLQSHAGYTDIGFRVYYEEKRERRFIVYAEEIPPPTQ